VGAQGAQLVSLDHHNVQARSATQAIVSKTGRFVLFLGQRDLANGQPFLDCEQWYLRDLQTGTTELISKNNLGQPVACVFPPIRTAPYETNSADISADGRFVVFDYWATNVVQGLAAPALRTYRVDRQLGQIALIGPDASIPAGVVSMDDVGRRVLVEVVPSVNQAELRVFDLVSGEQFPVVSRTFYTGNASISGNGQRVVYLGRSPTTPASVVPQIFVFDIPTGTHILASAAADGGYAASSQGSFPVLQPSINYDGSVVAFGANTSNLMSGPGPAILLRLMNEARTLLVSRDNQGNPVFPALLMDGPSISDDGSRVAFRSNGPTLPGGLDGTPGWPQVYVYDLATSRVSLVSRSPSGTSAYYGSSISDCEDPGLPFPCSLYLTLSPHISGNGRFVAFHSRGNNLVVPDANDNGFDVYLTDLGSVSQGLPSLPHAVASNSQLALAVLMLLVLTLGARSLRAEMSGTQ
jgi:Tol biopolymer transport system component